MVKKTKSYKKETSVSSLDRKDLLNSLETSVNIQSRDEYQNIADKLRSEYKKLAIKNLIEKKKLSLLTNEATALRVKNADIRAEVESVQIEHSAVDSKLNKLQQLSQQLSSRIKALDTKSTEDVKAEKENRLQMSNNFSASIKLISVKLEVLSSRRENIVTENARLKTLLKEYLEEFDKDKETDPEPETTEDEQENTDDAEGTTFVAKDVNEGADSAEEQSVASELELAANVLDPSVKVESVAHEEEKEDEIIEISTPAVAAADLANANATATATDTRKEATESVKELSAEEVAAEKSRLQDEQDAMKMLALQTKEKELREQTHKYMAMFDTFQSRLGASNAVFTDKQSSIESLTREIKTLEKETKQYITKLSELTKSNQTFFSNNDRMLQERVRLIRASDKYQELIDTFQAEIAVLETKL